MTKAVFIPGLLCTDALFAGHREGLSGILDIAIGDHRQDYTVSSIARRVLDQAPNEFICAGLSMGGYTSFEIMRQAPERVKALILMNTSARADTPEQTERRNGLMEIAKIQGLDAVTEALLPVFLGHTNLGREDLTACVREMVRETGLDTFLNQQTALMSRVDSRESLGAISVPTLVVVGDGDTLTPPKLAQEIAEGIPGAQLVIVENCGHLSSLEQPEVVNDAIRSFLSEAGITA